MSKPPKHNDELVIAYKLENPTCELWHHLDGASWDKMRGAWRRGKRRRPDDLPVDHHHIFGGHAHRWDIWPNLICVCRPVHDWLHKHPLHGKIACLWVKMTKEELDVDLLKECLGFNPIGRMASWNVTEEWVELMRQQLNERFPSHE